MILDSATSPLPEGVFVNLRNFTGPADVFLKIEAFNAAGSIKLKPAVTMIDAFEAAGRIGPGSRIVESSSGNLGLALAAICRARGYRFTCISDPNLSPHTHRMMTALGAEVVIVTQRDRNGGFLQTRIDLIHDLLAKDPSLTWINQYANPGNRQAHADWTAREILREFEKVDFLFIGAGTTGTVMGCGEVFRRESPATRIIAVDTQGSVTFGGPAGPRYIPGLGTSRRPEIVDETLVDSVLLVPEAKTVAMCREIASRYGFLLGGSSGTVLAGIRQMIDDVPAEATVVAVAPDAGERYLDTIYNDEWVSRLFPELRAGGPSAIPA
jgi:N-(2-amino-2-carboxyethyl)-L-glutamate synthase